jgi:hypothetical protein
MTIPTPSSVFDHINESTNKLHSSDGRGVIKQIHVGSSFKDRGPRNYWSGRYWYRFCWVRWPSDRRNGANVSSKLAGGDWTAELLKQSILISILLGSVTFRSTEWCQHLVQTGWRRFYTFHFLHSLIWKSTKSWKYCKRKYTFYEEMHHNHSTFEAFHACKWIANLQRWSHQHTFNNQQRANTEHWNSCWNMLIGYHLQNFL